MYHPRLIEWLEKITSEDYLPERALSQSIVIDDGTAEVAIDPRTRPVRFAVFGSPYLIAMMKWLQHMLTCDRISLIKYDMKALVAEFDLPEQKRRDAFLILRLIEKIADANK